MRIGIVDDLAMTRETLRRVITSTPDNQIAWLAADGAEAIECVRGDKPDLILMDLVMPVVDGVEATRRIMRDDPCPILIVTSNANRYICKVYEAMNLGALDVADTPTLGPQGDLRGASSLLSKIETLGKLMERPLGASTCGSRCHSDSREPLVAIGASTGGPNALVDVLGNFPKDFQAAVVIVQHIDVDLSEGLAQMLSEQTGRAVKIAEAGMRPTAGEILIAKTNDHLVLGCGRVLKYVVEPREMVYRPSVDVFFKSVAEHWPEPGVAVVLTGMGRDGASGLMTLKKAGWHTIAQDRATSVVWGMPRAAAELGAARQVLPLSEIGPGIVSHLRDHSPRTGARK
jgi:two-component system, chemotaxis family, response regulator WspF